MGSVNEIDNAIRGLSSHDLAALRAWFAEFDANSWDEQLEDAAAAAGRLDALADEALDDLRQGRCKDL